MYKIVELPKFQLLPAEVENKIDEMELKGYQLEFVSEKFLYFKSVTTTSTRIESKSETKRKNAKF